MGRPLNKKFFGELADAGTQVVLSANIGNGTENVFIVEQKGVGVYVVSNGSDTGKVKLKNGAPAAEGEAALTVTTYASATEYARTLNAHQVKTFSGNTYNWTFGAPADATQAKLNSESGNAPVNTVAPAITGTAQVGQTLTVTNGTWTGASTYARQWYADDVAIAGATATTYVLTEAEEGAVITVVVTATSSLGVTATKTSNATDAVIA